MKHYFLSFRSLNILGASFPLTRERRNIKTWLIAMALVISMPVHAAVEYHPFDDPKQEEAYQTLISELRCLVCQNQTIADSNADLAKDLRNQVYEMLQQGKTEQDVVAFMTERYGDFVLYRPAFNFKTGLLWLGPALFLFVGILVVYLVARGKKSVRESVVLDAEQQRQLDDILQKGTDD